MANRESPLRPSGENPHGNPRDESPPPRPTYSKERCRKNTLHHPQELLHDESTVWRLLPYDSIGDNGRASEDDRTTPHEPSGRFPQTVPYQDAPRQGAGLPGDTCPCCACNPAELVPREGCGPVRHLPFCRFTQRRMRPTIPRPPPDSNTEPPD